MPLPSIYKLAGVSVRSNRDSRKILEKALHHWVENFCTVRKKFLETEAGKRQIRKAATNNRLRFGNASYFNRTGERKRATLVDGLKLSVQPTRKGLMLAELEKFPDFLTAQQGYRRLQSAVARQGFTINDKTKAGQKADRKPGRKLDSMRNRRRTVGYGSGTSRQLIHSLTNTDITT